MKISYLFLKKSIPFILLVFFWGYKTTAQNVAINNTKALPDVSAMLDIQAADKGLLIPRVALDGATDLITVPSPATGLIVYNTNPDMKGAYGTGFYYNKGSNVLAKWEKLIEKSDLVVPPVCWQTDGNSNVNAIDNFIGTNKDVDVVFKRNGIEAFRINAGGAILATGSATDGITPISVPGPKLMWIPKKFSFRAGSVAGTQWDAANIGEGSVAMGYQNTASGKYAFTVGSNSMASGENATAIGNLTTASGKYSFVAGSNSMASGENATAIGELSTASGKYALALGNGSTASAESATAISGGTAEGKSSFAFGVSSLSTKYGAVAIGYSVTASGEASFAAGFNTIAQAFHSTALGTDAVAIGDQSTAIGNTVRSYGENSTAMGYLTEAYGDNSTALGHGTRAASYASLAIGTYNNLTKNPGNIQNCNDTVFQIGNGTDKQKRNDALWVTRKGNLYLAGTVVPLQGMACPSDIRLKKDIQPLQNVLNNINKIQPITYYFKNQAKYSADHQIGFSAQEIEKEFPELVKKTDDGYLSVNYPQMTAVAIQAIKEQQEIIQNQSNTIKVLKETVLDMNKRIQQLEKLVHLNK